MFLTAPPPIATKLAAAIVRIDNSIGLRGSAFCHLYTGHKGKFVCTVDQGQRHNGTRCFRAVFWFENGQVWASRSSMAAISCRNTGLLGA